MSVPRVGITGMGVLTGYGRGVDALWSGLSSGKSAVREHRAHLGRQEWLHYPMAALRDDIDTMASELPNAHFVRENRLASDPDLIALAECVRAHRGLSGADDVQPLLGPSRDAP